MDEIKKLEIVYQALINARNMIELAYKKNGAISCDIINDFTDDKIQDYYFKLNEMCLEISDRGVFAWQKEE